ncbi:MAG: hypothetical protein KDA80_21005 [Planctomycetaceae bacterium]|nr:hypothetical protein [Planctomycetaceae bacterium]
MGTPLAMYERLVDQIELLNGELISINEVLEAIRTDFAWAVQNGRVNILLDDPAEIPDATVDQNLIELTIRFQTSLATFIEELRMSIDERLESKDDDGKPLSDTEWLASLQAAEPKKPTQKTLFGDGSNRSAGDSFPSITLFEVGETVECLYEEKGQQAEILYLDDARNSATIRLIGKEVQKMVSQDAIQKVGTPEEVD